MSARRETPAPGSVGLDRPFLFIALARVLDGGPRRQNLNALLLLPLLKESEPKALALWRGLRSALESIASADATNTDAIARLLPALVSAGSDAALESTQLDDRAKAWVSAVAFGQPVEPSSNMPPLVNGMRHDGGGFRGISF